MVITAQIWLYMHLSVCACWTRTLPVRGGDPVGVLKSGYVFGGPAGKVAPIMVAADLAPWGMR